MKIFSVLLIMVMVGCVSLGGEQNIFGTQYKYTYKLLESSKNDMTWSDSNMHLSFAIYDTQIAFWISNTTNDPIKIIWDETSISILGMGQKVMHKGIKYADRSAPQPPTTIPPRVLFEEFIVPVDNVYWREGFYSRYGSSPGGWETHDLLPTHDFNKLESRTTILSLKGKKLVLYLPIEIAGAKKTYPFTFEVLDVVPTISK